MSKHRPHRDHILRLLTEFEPKKVHAILQANGYAFSMQAIYYWRKKALVSGVFRPSGDGRIAPVDGLENSKTTPAPCPGPIGIGLEDGMHSEKFAQKWLIIRPLSPQLQAILKPVQEGHRQAVLAYDWGSLVVEDGPDETFLMLYLTRLWHGDPEIVSTWDRTERLRIARAGVKRFSDEFHQVVYMAPLWEKGGELTKGLTGIDRVPRMDTGNHAEVNASKARNEIEFNVSTQEGREAARRFAAMPDTLALILERLAGLEAATTQGLERIATILERVVPREPQGPAPPADDGRGYG